MNFDYSDEQKLLQQSVRNLFKNKFPIQFARESLEKEEISQNLVKVLAGQGLLGVMYEDEKYINEGLIYSVLISYEIGRVLLPFPLIESHVVSYVLSKYSKGKTYLEQIMTGEKIFTFGWKKKESRNSKSNKINSTFSFVPFALASDFMMIQTNLGSNSAGLVMINLKSENVEIVKLNSMDQTYPVYEVKLINYEFKNEDIIVEDDNSEILNSINQIASLMICAEAVGASEEILEKTIAYTKERVQFGQPVAKFQAVKHLAADMYMLLESTRAALKYASSVISSDNYNEYNKVTHLLKAYTSDSCNELMGISVQLHGGIGFTWESDVHMYYKRARRIGVMHGDAYEHNEKLFKEVLIESESYKK